MSPAPEQCNPKPLHDQPLFRRSESEVLGFEPMKSAEEKVRIAARLGGGNGCAPESVAQKLRMGSVAYVAERLSEWRNE